MDPALTRPGRLDRKIEFGLPDLEGRTHIFKIHAKTMNMERDIRFELLARLCPNCTGESVGSLATSCFLGFVTDLADEYLMYCDCLSRS